MHAQGTVDSVVNVLISIVVKFAAIALGEKLGIGGDHAQRFLQIMGGYVRKLLQVTVRARQFFQRLIALLAQSLLVYGSPHCLWQSRQVVLQNVVGSPLLDTLHRFEFAECTGHDDDRDFHSIPLRQLVVSENDIVGISAHLLSEFLCRLRDLAARFKFTRLQGMQDKREVCGVVLDYEDPQN